RRGSRRADHSSAVDANVADPGGAHHDLPRGLRSRRGGAPRVSEHAVAIIPARGNSRRIPRKNLVPLAGLPLVAHSIRHALASTRIAEVYVSTDDAEIAAVARAHGAEVVMRPAQLAEDGATSESALLHTLDERRAHGHADPDLV